MTLPSKKADLITVVLIAIGFGYLYYHTYSFSPSILPGYPGDAFFPRIVIGFSLACCGVIILRSVREYFARYRSTAKEKSVDSMVTIELIPFAFNIALVLAFIFLLPVIGFEVCTFLFLFILLIARWHDALKPRIIKVALLSLGTAVSFYFVFVILLNVSFPVKLLPDYIQIF